MTLSFCTNLAVRLHPFRWVLLATALIVVAATWALVFFFVVPGRVALPTLIALAMPPLAVLWAGVCCTFWFHPERGTLSANGFAVRRFPPAAQSFVRWYAATFLVFFVLVGVLGPLLLAR